MLFNFKCFPKKIIRIYKPKSHYMYLIICHRLKILGNMIYTYKDQGMSEKNVIKSLDF